MWTFPGTEAAACKRLEQGSDGTADLRRETRPGELESSWQTAAALLLISQSSVMFDV